MKLTSLITILFIQKFCYCGWPGCCCGSNDDYSPAQGNSSPEVAKRSFHKISSASLDLSLVDAAKDGAGATSGKEGDSTVDMLILDLNSEEVGDYEVVTNTEYGLTNIAYFPKNGRSISLVTASEEVIWASGDGKKCLGVRAYSRDSKTMLSLLIGNGTTNNNVNFRKERGKWVEVTDNLTFRRMVHELKELPNGPTKGPRRKLTSQTFVPYTSE